MMRRMEARISSIEGSCTRGLAGLMRKTDQKSLKNRGIVFLIMTRTIPRRRFRSKANRPPIWAIHRFLQVQ
jgi:hypothetical protein